MRGKQECGWDVNTVLSGVDNTFLFFSFLFFSFLDFILCDDRQQDSRGWWGNWSKGCNRNRCDNIEAHNGYTRERVKCIR